MGCSGCGNAPARSGRPAPPRFTPALDAFPRRLLRHERWGPTQARRPLPAALHRGRGALADNLATRGSAHRRAGARAGCRCRTQQRIGAGPAGARADRSVPARFVDRARRRTHLANAPASATPVPAVRRHRGHARRTPGGTGRHAVGAECARAPLGAALCRPSGARAGSGAVTAARGQRSPAARRGGTRRRRSRRDRPGAARRTGSGARPRRARPRGIVPRRRRAAPPRSPGER